MSELCLYLAIVTSRPIAVHLGAWSFRCQGLGQAGQKVRVLALNLGLQPSQNKPKSLKHFPVHGSGNKAYVLKSSI